MNVDIGSEPALALDAASGEAPPQRWAFTLRWLACTLLAGIAGGALVSGALVTAFDGEYEFARPAGVSAAVASDGDALPSGTTGKQDKIVTVARNFATRQIIHENFVRNVGGKDLITVRPYVRINASLELSTGQYADKIPAFNPIKLFADAAQPVSAPDTDDQFVKLEESDLLVRGPYDQTGTLTMHDIKLAVAELAEFAPTQIAYASGSGDEGAGSGDGTGDGTGDAAFAGLKLGTGDIRASYFSPTPPPPGGKDDATVSLVKKQPALVAGEGEPMQVEVRRGDTLMTILVDHGATREEAMDAIRMIKARAGRTDLAEGDVVDMIVAPDAEGRERPVRIAIGNDRQAGVLLASSGEFIYDDGNIGAMQIRGAGSSGAPRPSLFASVYATALRHGLPDAMVDDLVRILSFDVDYQRPVQPGDALEVFYNAPEEEGGDEPPQILYAAITVRGETHRLFRYRTPDDGFVDYYDATGHSAKKFLMRKPMNGGVFRSPFGMRSHPILGYKRMHTGVDWAAPSGTPIFASGNGTVVSAGWKSGYGKYTDIRHANGYETGYAHQSAFAKGIEPGTKVRQGQIIGYVGSTGLSTGPHLHYEVRVNGRLVDPMRIRLPRGRVLNGRMLGNFERERARVEALMNSAPASTRIAGLND
ncbi:MAG: M23 family metallopeptidase [Flavobacteriaceae bacterium]